MGQKQVSDHSKDLLKRPSVEDFDEMERTEKIEQEEKKEKSHLNIEFNMDDPKKSRNKHKVEETNTRNGLIMHHIPRGISVKYLKINILSNLFGTRQQYKNSNFNILFGMKIDRTIDNINIFLVNSTNYGVFHDREAVKEILDNACFKVKKKLVINQFYNYYIYPRMSEFSILLTVQNSAFDRIDQFQDDIFCNPYARFNACLFNLERCRKSIIEIQPKEKNIILPSFRFDLVNRQLKSLEDFETLLNIYDNQTEDEFETCKISNIPKCEEERVNDTECILNYDMFFSFLSEKFQNLCFEIELRVEDCSDEVLLKKINFIDYFFDKFRVSFSKFKNIMISIQFINNNFYKRCNDWKVFNPHCLFLRKFKEILSSLNEINLTIALHYSFNEVINKNLRIYNSYDSVYYDKEMITQAYTLLFVLKKAKVYKKIRSKKPILMGIMNALYGYSKIKVKRLNYDVDVVNNKKFVPVQLGKNNVDWLNT